MEWRNDNCRRIRGRSTRQRPLEKIFSRFFFFFFFSLLFCWRIKWVAGLGKRSDWKMFKKKKFFSFIFLFVAPFFPNEILCLLFTGFYRVLSRVCRFIWVLMGFTGFLLGFCWVLLGFTGFHWVFIRFHWVLLGCTGFYWFYWVLPGFTEIYWVLLGFTGFHWVFAGFYWVFAGFYWV